jgi:hypothetical protein
MTQRSDMGGIEVGASGPSGEERRCPGAIGSTEARAGNPGGEKDFLMTR